MKNIIMLLPRQVEKKKNDAKEKRGIIPENPIEDRPQEANARKADMSNQAIIKNFKYIPN